MKLTPLQRGLLIAGILFAAFIYNRPAHAAGGCGQRELFRAALKEKYHEVPNKMAIAGSAVVELFLSPEKSWTILVTDMTGKSCIIAAGHNWTDAPVQIEGTPL